MSYTISVRTEDGQASVQVSGEVPDGVFTVSGHEDDSQRQLSVTRQGLDGRYVATAGHTHYKEQ